MVSVRNAQDSRAFCAGPPSAIPPELRNSLNVEYVIRTVTRAASCGEVGRVRKLEAERSMGA